MSDAAKRYALYYTPAAKHPLTRAAARWLGRDAFGGSVGALSADDAALTAEPRRYGFHATLKPPFRLREGRNVAELERAVEAFAGSHRPCPIGALSVSLIGSFFALVPARPLRALRVFAGQAVSDLDAFRAPLNKDELAKRLRSPLDEAQTANLVRWGYPYVFDEFRFHMTLTGPVEPDRQEGVRQRLETLFTPLLDEDFLLDAVSLFEQDGPDGDFVVRASFPTIRHGGRQVANAGR
jgi:putative phosphonate metabolism protein